MQSSSIKPHKDPLQENALSQVTMGSLEAGSETESQVSTAEIRRQVIDLAAPELTEMVLISFVGVADMIMVGRLGPPAIAAVGLPAAIEQFILRGANLLM